jgi:multidrug resistance efflux pump
LSGGIGLKKRIVITVFFLLLFGVGILVYLGQRNVQQRELYYSGTIEAKHAELGFQVSGRIRDVLVDEGQLVEKDQALAVLDQSEYQARHEQAKAHLESFIKNLQRLEMALKVYEKSLPDEVARAEAGVKVLLSLLFTSMAIIRKKEAGTIEQELLHL